MILDWLPLLSRQNVIIRLLRDLHADSVGNILDCDFLHGYGCAPDLDDTEGALDLAQDGIDDQFAIVHVGLRAVAVGRELMYLGDLYAESGQTLQSSFSAGWLAGW